MGKPKALQISPERPWLESAEQRLMSVDEADQRAAIELLLEHPTPDSARELIRLYFECAWRETRIQILRALGSIPIHRSIEFLIQVVLNEKQVASSALDYPLLESAIWALGQTNHPVACRFLASYYQAPAPEPLLPAVVGALSHFPALHLSELFLKDLATCLKKRNWMLARNLVLALGEMKSTQALPHLETLIRKPLEPHLTWAALIAFGKINRSVDRLSCLEQALQDTVTDPITGRPTADPIDRHFLTLIHNQTQFRSQWSVEHYLSRWFEPSTPTSKPHRQLPIELNQFTASEVHAGLQLYQERIESLSSCVSQLQFHEVSSWYLEFFKTDGEIESALTGMVSQNPPGAFELLRQWKDRCLAKPNSSLARSYLRALSLCCGMSEGVEQEWLAIFESQAYHSLTHEEALHWIQAWSDYALPAASTPQTSARTKQMTERLASQARTPLLRARWIRLLSHLKGPSAWIAHQAPDWLKLPNSADLDLLQSLGVYLEAHPHKRSLEWTLSILEQRDQWELSPTALSVWIRALTQAITEFQECSPSALQGARISKILFDLLRQCKDRPSSLSHLHLARSILVCLSEFPKSLAQLTPCTTTLAPLLREFLEDSTATSLHLLCIVSMRNFPGPESSEALIPFLRAENSIAFRGRAIDSICHQLQLEVVSNSASRSSPTRPLRILLDCLESQLDDPNSHSLQDRILRQFDSMEISPPPPADWIARIEKWQNRFPDHPHLDRWSKLLARWKLSGSGSSGRKGLQANEANEKLDQHLSQKVKGYAQLPESVKTAVRSAELPLIHPDLFNDHVDKSASILEYTKAIDTAFEKIYGEPLLFPSLEGDLAAFQNRLYSFGLHDPHPDADRVLRALELEDQFTPSTLQLHKMGLLAQTVLNGRVLMDGFKAIDGLRAWAIFLLWFSRPLPKSGQPKALIPPKSGTSASAIAQLARKMIALQEARNPAAHRQIFLETKDVESVRQQFYDIMSGLIYYFQ